MATEIALTGAGRPRERADAARNRAKVLAAAERVFAEAGGASEVTMEDIARAAGVGRATLYRRYPDTGSIARALLDTHESELQERILRGEPPLGPGAPPVERLSAFYEAMVDLLERHLHLVLGAETGRARYRTGVYSLWRRHVELLLGPGVPQAVVDGLLAPLAPELYEYERRGRGLTPSEIKQGLVWLATRCCRPGPSQVPGVD